MRTALLCLVTVAALGSVDVGAVRIIVDGNGFIETRTLDNSTCPTGTRYCPDDRCLADEFWCDGVKHCSGGVDEKNCASCSPRGFFCDGHCIKAIRRCDRTPDCRDGADEADCGVIPEDDIFTCSDKKTRRKIARCDGDRDCKDDELGCTQEMCQDGALWCTAPLLGDGCWSRSFRCDAREWCSDKSDEKGCSFEVEEVIVPITTTPEPTTTTTTPAPLKGTRPENCAPGSRWCVKKNFGRCVRDEFWCDGHADCDDSVDEMNCTTCSRYGFRCDNKCIRRAYKCDSFADCEDGADEKDCPSKEVIRQATKGTCRSPYKRIKAFTQCDGVNDCVNSEEERQCESCTGGAHYCNFGCLPASMVCDGIIQCRDDSDEDNCEGAGAKAFEEHAVGESKP